MPLKMNTATTILPVDDAAVPGVSIPKSWVSRTAE